MSGPLDGKVFIEVRANEYTMRDRNPNVPWSPEELAADAAACRDAGAAVFHFHARDPETGAASGVVEHYADTLRRIKATTDLVVMPTLGASTIPDPGERVAHIPVLAADRATRPDLAPVDLGSFNVDPFDPVTATFRTEDLVYHTSVRSLRQIIGTVRDVGVAPMAALWNVGSARLLGAFLQTGDLVAPTYAQVTLSNGFLSAHPGTERGLTAMLDFLPEHRGVVWSMLCFGADLLPLVPLAVERGGHVAIGLGDHPYTELGAAPTNADVVAEVVRIVRSLGREPATPTDVRAALALPR